MDRLYTRRQCEVAFVLRRDCDLTVIGVYRNRVRVRLA